MSEDPRSPSFDFGKATFQGFRLPGGKSYLIRVAFWAAVLLMAVYVLLGTPILKGLLEFSKKTIAVELGFREAEAALPIALRSFIWSILGFYILIVICQVAIFVSAETAIYRNLLHQENKGFFPLRFGRQELRVLGTRLVIGLLLGPIILGVIILAALLTTSVFGVAWSSILVEVSGSRVGLISLLFFVVFVVLFWMSVRLAPASAYCVKSNAFRPLGSWSAMRGFVWRGVGSLLILFLIGAVALGLIYVVLFSILLLSSGILQALMKIGQGPDGVAEFFLALIDNITSASFILPLIGTLFIFVFLSMIWYGAIWAMWGYYAKIGGSPTTIDNLATHDE